MDGFIRNKYFETLIFLSVVFYYGFDFIRLNKLSFLIYVLLFIIIYTLKYDFRVNSFNLSFRSNAFVTIHKISVLLFLVFFIFNFEEKYLPNFFQINVFDRLNNKPLGTSLFRSFVNVSSLLLITKKNKKEIYIGILGAFLLFLSSSSTSRGGLILFFSFFAPLFFNKKKIIYFFLPIIIICFSVFSYFIISLRGIATSSINPINLDFISSGYQKDFLKFLLYPIPGFLKGEWQNTNYILSETLAPYGDTFYVITFGDFVNVFYGYGYSWIFILIFSLLNFKLFKKIFNQYFKVHNIYWLVFVILIAARVGIESFITIFFADLSFRLLYMKLFIIYLHGKKLFNF